VSRCLANGHIRHNKNNVNLDRAEIRCDFSGSGYVAAATEVDSSVGMETRARTGWPRSREFQRGQDIFLSPASRPALWLTQSPMQRVLGAAKRQGVKLTIIQNRRCTCRDSNQSSPEFKLEAYRLSHFAGSFRVIIHNHRSIRHHMTYVSDVVK
jgi:hypothetical protein